MLAAVVPVAGCSARFQVNTDKGMAGSAGAGSRKPVLKCIYTEGSQKETLLWNIFDSLESCDRIIVVGGYQFEELSEFIKDYVRGKVNGWKNKIRLVYNPYYQTYGTGYSFFKGMEALNEEFGEEDKVRCQVLLVEGDLYYDRETMQSVLLCEKDVITVNRECIDTCRAVVVYKNEAGFLRYLYSTEHKTLQIEEPFWAVYNSAQIWKFQDFGKLRRLILDMEEEKLHGTNLEPIQQYFGTLSSDNYQIILFNTWINCNTRVDYNRMVSMIHGKAGADTYFAAEWKRGLCR